MYEQLVLPELPSDYQDLSVYEFVKKKTYQEMGCLIYPTMAMVSFVENLERIFCASFEQIIYMPFILTQLCKTADEECQFLTCQEMKCILKVKNMVKLYMKVRIHHALKRSNMQNVEDKGTKRKRKMVKLSHM